MAKKATTKKSTSRRGNNEGTIYQRADGLWTAQVSVGHDSETGKLKRKTIYGKSRTEVAMKMNTLVSDVYKHGYQNSTNDTLEILMRHWLQIYKKSEVSSRTYEKKVTNCKLYIFPNIGQFKLNEIKPDMLQTLFTNLLEKKKLCVDTVKKCKYLLSQFFEYAVENKYMTFNPTTKTTIKARDRDKKTNEDEYKAIRPEHRSAFMDAIKQHHFWKPFCMTAMFGSLRAGELLALKWRNVDLENGFIIIENAVTQVVTFDENDNVKSRKTVIGDTKTAASERENPMPKILVEALAEYNKRRKLEEALLGKSLTNHDDLVFSTAEGQLRTYSGTRTMFERFLKKHGLHDKNIHFHTLRHTFSNMLWEAGENPKVIQGLMGHKDVKTTMIYNSVDKRQYSSATTILDKVGFEM